MLWVLLPIAFGFFAMIVISIMFVSVNDFVIIDATFLVLGILIESAMGFGFWWLTSPEPQPDPSISPPAKVRRWARGLLMASLALALVSYTLGVFRVSSYGFSSLVPEANAPTPSLAIEIIDGVISALDSLNGFTVLIGGLCLAVVLRRLALRAPHDGMAKETRSLFWAWASVFILSFVGLGVYFVIQWLNTNSPSGQAINLSITLTGVLGCGFGLLTFALAIWTLILMIRYRLLFKRHAGYARLRVPQQPVRPRHL
ncbi:MAG: hypothetical protein AAGH99_02510 [Planctomycetota bacterium]